eukprot:TRINITY_DN73760_c0_g1_i1.p2 TRINITY_DN73760_c0_g1~~TRINITY_DN73760_c0_g1_i1.p2  ORF type:complete len:176 (-),score=21.78 TRINITY_DN73760_c0_g1_i1:41-538(-)
MSARLPVRKIAETAYAGVSKRPSHRTLPEFQRFELLHKFPRFPQIFGVWIARRIKRGSSGGVHDHPCLRVFDTFLHCCRRHPDTHESKCRTEAGKCLACLEENEGWKMPMRYDYMRFLEHFRLFSEGRQSNDEGVGKFRYKPDSPDQTGAGTVMKFSGVEPKKGL